MPCDVPCCPGSRKEKGDGSRKEKGDVYEGDIYATSKAECTEDRGGRLQSSSAQLHKMPWTGVAQWLRG